MYRLRIECWRDENGVNRMVGGPGIVRDFEYVYVPLTEEKTEAAAVKLHALAMEHGIECPKCKHGHRGTLIGLERFNPEPQLYVDF